VEDFYFVLKFKNIRNQKNLF